MNERIIPDYGSLLAGKTAFITTAARGIGRSIARLFARQGATVYFAGRNPAYVKQTEAELRQLRPGCRGYVCDLAQTGESEETARQALEETRLLLERLEVEPLHFTSDHASNYLPLKGGLPEDKARLLSLLDGALSGGQAVRPELWRGL